MAAGPGGAAVTFCAGFSVFVAQACLITVVAGPIIGGAMLANHWTLTQVFVAASVPALLGAAGSMLMGWYAPAGGRKPLISPSHGPALGG